MKKTTASALLFVLTFALTLSSVGRSTASECVFSDHADDLADDPRFEKKILGETLKISRIRSDSGKPLYVRVIAIRDTKSGKNYHLNLSEAPEWTGDESKGWIEAMDGVAENKKGAGSVVAEIHDSFIRCVR
jgi:hypothetical protein